MVDQGREEWRPYPSCNNAFSQIRELSRPPPALEFRCQLRKQSPDKRHQILHAPPDGAYGKRDHLNNSYVPAPDVHHQFCVLSPRVSAKANRSRFSQVFASPRPFENSTDRAADSPQMPAAFLRAVPHYSADLYQSRQSGTSPRLTTPSSSLYSRQFDAETSTTSVIAVGSPAPSPRAFKKAARVWSSSVEPIKPDTLSIAC